MPQLSLFISCVSNEFGHYRDVLRRDFSRPNLTTKIQEDFIDYGNPTLHKLDDYIRNCDAIIHICGNMTGSMANDLSLEYINRTYPDFRHRCPELLPVLDGSEQMSYTQWEAWLAAYHHKSLFVATPNQDTVRHTAYQLLPEQQVHQQRHLSRLKARGYYNGILFSTEEGLALRLYRSYLGDLMARLQPDKPIYLPYHTIGNLFKGRDESLTELHKGLKKDAARPAAIIGNTIHGLGGIGKTRLAVEYAWSYRNEYTALLFVTADTPENIFSNLAGLSAPTILNLAEYAAPEDRRRYDAVIRWLNGHPGWLLILDNADTKDCAIMVEKLYARLSGGLVLITSRQKDWSPQVSQLQLGVLESADAISFLLERTAAGRRKTNEDSILAGLIAEELGYLALALEQVGAYIKTRKFTFEQYRKTWQNNHNAVLEWYDERLMQYPKSVAITWQTSVNQLSAPAKTLMDRLAWLAPNPIPESLLEIKASDEDAVDGFTALIELAEFSLVNRSEDKPEFVIHRLVQDVTRRKQEKGITENMLATSLSLVNNAFKTDDSHDVNTLMILEPLIPHALLLITYVEKNEVIYKAAKGLMNQLGALLLIKAQYKEAEPIIRRALAINKQSLGENHPDFALSLNNLAQLLKSTDRLKEAEPLMRKVLMINELNFGKNHPKVALSLNNLGRLLERADRLKEAEPIIRRALEINKQNFGGSHPSVAVSLNNLALLLQDTDRLKEAEPLIRQALAIDEKHFGKNHPNVAVDLSNLAALLQAINQLAEAEPLIRRALTIDEKHFGKNHPYVAIRLNNLAQLLQSTNRQAEAELLMRRVLVIDKRHFGVNHSIFASDLNNLAQLLKSMNRLEEAQSLTHQACIIFIKNLGFSHSTTRKIFNNYALILQAIGRSKEEIGGMLSSLFK